MLLYKNLCHCGHILSARSLSLSKGGRKEELLYNNPMPFMYILQCSDGSFYTGSTWDLDARLYEHQNGIGANYTKKRLPVQLIYFEYYDRIADAFYREKQIQGWSRRKKIALIQDKPELLVEYSKSYQRRETQNEMKENDE